MKNKTSLTLMELVIMLLVLACAAALCLRAFLWADQTAGENAARDRAVLLCQNAAETLKDCGSAGGDMTATLALAAERLGGRVELGLWYMDYDENWQPVSGGSAAYQLCAQGVPAEAGLWQARVWVDAPAYDGGGEPLFALTAAWQEVAP